jgi:hypothetical protein
MLLLLLLLSWVMAVATSAWSTERGWMQHGWRTKLRRHSSNRVASNFVSLHT